VRIFSLGNTKHVGFWCAAPDESTARAIVLKAGHVKSDRGITGCQDVTDHFLAHPPDHHDIATIRAIVDGNVTGRVYGQGHSYTIQEVMQRLKTADETGQKPPPKARTTWHVTPIAV
jgi:hypothetical protein